MIIRLEDNPIFKQRRIESEIENILSDAEKMNQRAETAIKEMDSLGYDKREYTS